MTPDQLRASILQQAIEGKLIKQNSNDEPASELLKKIKNEKDQLVKEKKVKRTKDFPEITNDEKPFRIPKSWKWVRLGTVSNYIQRGKSPKYATKGNQYPIISQKCVQWNGISLEKARYITPEFVQSLEKRRFVHENDILWCSTGTGTVGRLNILKKKYDKVPVDSHVTIVRINKNVNQKFILYYLMSPTIQFNLDKMLTGSTKQKELGLRVVQNVIVPLPPFTEQERIVAKIEQLMPLVDEYAESYNRLKELDDGFDDRLKDSILQYAMEGKLVKQDPNDEPASELLKKIKAEKDQLIKEKKIKRTKKLPEITDDEKPFEIPDSWEWVRVGEVSNYIQRGRSPKYSKNDSQYPVISQKCVQWDEVSLKEAKYVTPEFVNSLEQYRFVQQNDILWCSTGTGTVGRLNILKRKYNKVPVDSHVTIVRINKNVSSVFALYYLMSPTIQFNLDEMLTGSTKQKELGLGVIQNIVMPLPPLNEQIRIVEKVDQLLQQF